MEVFIHSFIHNTQHMKVIVGITQLKLTLSQKDNTRQLINISFYVCSQEDDITQQQKRDKANETRHKGKNP